MYHRLSGLNSRENACADEAKRSHHQPLFSAPDPRRQLGHDKGGFGCRQIRSASPKPTAFAKTTDFTEQAGIAHGQNLLARSGHALESPSLRCVSSFRPRVALGITKGRESG
jgi:hypothetical protein